HLVEPRIFHAASLGGALSERETRAARDAWVTSMRGSGLFDPERLWAAGLASAASTPAEAADVLATMPSVLLADAGTYRAPMYITDTFAGRALLLGGRRREALPLLKTAGAACHALIDPFLVTWAQAWLGEALEGEGDKAGACKAYAV